MIFVKEKGLDEGLIWSQMLKIGLSSSDAIKDQRPLAGPLETPARGTEQTNFLTTTLLSLFCWFALSVSYDATHTNGFCCHIFTLTGFRALTFGQFYLGFLFSIRSHMWHLFIYLLDEIFWLESLCWWLAVEVLQKYFESDRQSFQGALFLSKSTPPLKKHFILSLVMCILLLSYLKHT